jgi:hypothetical protein
MRVALAAVLQENLGKKAAFRRQQVAPKAGGTKPPLPPVDDRTLS